MKTICDCNALKRVEGDKTRKENVVSSLDHHTYNPLEWVSSANCFKPLRFDMACDSDEFRVDFLSWLGVLSGWFSPKSIASGTVGATVYAEVDK